MRTFAAAFRFQLQVVAGDPNYLMPLVTVPMFTIVFLAIAEHAGRDDLTAYGVVAPVLIALWTMSLFVSGEIVDSDRWFGALEPAIAAPASFPVVLVARVFAVTAIALLSLPEVWVVARLVFDAPLTVHHPLAFALTLLATTIATSGTAVVMSALFVVARSVRTFQNALTYPFYVLGGVLVPVTFLPGWIQPLAKAVFLSWSSDLLRASLSPAPLHDLALRLGVVLGLGALGFALGSFLVVRMLGSVRASGTLGFA